MDTDTVTLVGSEEECYLGAVGERAPEDGRRLRWFELGLVLLVALGNFVFSSFNRYAGVPVRWGGSQNLRWAAMLAQEMIALLLLGYVLSRRKLRISDLGLRWSPGELGPGALVAAVSYGAYMLGYMVLTWAHGRLFGSPAHGASLHSLFGYANVMMLVFSLVNPFFEELIVRAYLMTEIKELTGSWTLAALVSTVLQTAYHLYYGWTMALALGCQFLVFSMYYARTRRAMPLVVAHAVFDLVGVVQLI